VKTISLKRVALVAVSALGISLVGSYASNAANEVTYDKVTAINLYKVTSTPAVGSAVIVNVGLTTAGLTGSTSFTLVGKVAAPAGGFVQVNAVNTITGGSAASITNHYAGGSAGDVTGASILIPGGANTSALLAGSTAASATTGVASMTFTPTVAGTYTLTVWHNTTAGGSTDVDFNETRQTIDLVVVAAATATGGASLMSSFSGTVTAIGAGSTSDVGIIGSRSIGTQRAAAAVAVKGSSGAAFNGATLGCEIKTGPGLCVVDASTTATVGTARSSSVVLTGASAGYVHVSGDGTSGTGEVTVTVTDPTTAVKTTVGTFKVTFYSSTVATLTVTQNYANIGASTVHGCSSTTCTGTTYSTGSAGKPAVLIVAKDSSGMVIPALTLTATSSDSTVIASSTVTAVNESVNDANGLGSYNASVTGAPGAISGKTATVTYSITNADTTKISSAAVTFTVGGTTIASEALSFDKTAYAPGEAMVVTRTAKDTAGNPVADGTASPAVTFSKSVGGTAPAAGFYIAGKSATSATAPTVFAPALGGSFSGLMTGGDIAATKYTAAASVTDANAGLLTQIDALNAKIVALNALIAKIMKKLGVK
jgi:hypothetical protein